MKNKLMYLTSFSLKRKIKTKWFLIANILFAFIIIGVSNIDNIINFFGGDFNQKVQVYVLDNTNYTFDTLKPQIDGISLNTDGSEGIYEAVIYDGTIEEAKLLLEEEVNNLVLIIDEDKETVLKVTLISEGYLDTIDYQLFNTAINNTKVAIAMSQSNIDTDELTKIYSAVNIERIYLDETKTTDDENMEMIISSVFPIIILPFFMLIMFLVQMIGAEVNDEKTTRGMEMIISSVSPKTHFFSKIIAGNVFILLQGFLLLLYGGIGLFVRNIIGSSGITDLLGSSASGIFDGLLNSGLFDKMILIIPVTLLLMILTFLAYSLLTGVLASMTTNAEDFSQLQTPIILVSLVGYYLSLMAGMFDGALFIRVLSYVPFISAILSPSLLVLEQIGIFDVIISIILIIITNVLLIKYGLKIYKVGILNYSSKNLWKKMFKAMKD
ncbi:MAG: ABC transporter permease [Bacilli bacterium]